MDRIQFQSRCYFFIDAKLFWGVSSQGERVTKVRSVQTAEQTVHAL